MAFVVVVSSLASWPDDGEKGLMGRPCNHEDPRWRSRENLKLWWFTPQEAKWEDWCKSRAYQTQATCAPNEHQAQAVRALVPHPRVNQSALTCTLDAHPAHEARWWQCKQRVRFLWNITIIYFNIPLCLLKGVWCLLQTSWEWFVLRFKVGSVGDSREHQGQDLATPRGTMARH